MVKSRLSAAARVAEKRLNAILQEDLRRTGIHHSSEQPGVSYTTKQRKWRAQHKGKYLGIFKTENEAIEARRQHVESLEK